MKGGVVGFDRHKHWDTCWTITNKILTGSPSRSALGRTKDLLMLVVVTGYWYEKTSISRSSPVSSLFSVVGRNKIDRDVIFPVFKSQSLLGIKRQLSLFRAY